MKRLSRQPRRPLASSIAAFTVLCGLLAAPSAGAQNGAVEPPASQQESAPQEEGVIPMFEVDTSLVVLHCTVTDKKDRLVTDLKQEDFAIYEDGERMPIRLFLREDVPVSVGILVDNSGSMRDKRLKVNAAAVDFVKASNPEDEVFIVNFNDELHRDSEFTNDIPTLQDALQLIDSRGGTALYDAVLASLDYIKENAKHDKRVILVISDGEDNASRTELELLVRDLQEQDSQIVVYAVGLLSDEEPRAAKRASRAIRHLTSSTGGPSYFPETVDEIEALVRQIAADIRNQYTITYSPTGGKAPGFRRVEVKLEGKAGKGASVRHRPGYFGQ